jgi:uncharacterized protein
MLFKLIAFGLIAYVAYRFVRGWILGQTRPTPVNRTDPGQIDDVMVQDPQCGAYFPRRDGVALRHAGRDLLFCSRECRDRFISANSNTGK